MFYGWSSVVSKNGGSYYLAVLLHQILYNPPRLHKKIQQALQSIVRQEWMVQTCALELSALTYCCDNRQQDVLDINIRFSSLAVQFCFDCTLRNNVLNLYL